MPPQLPQRPFPSCAQLVKAGDSWLSVDRRLLCTAEDSTQAIRNVRRACSTTKLHPSSIQKILMEHPGLRAGPMEAVTQKRTAESQTRELVGRQISDVKDTRASSGGVISS